jgi:hypothetical protein
LRGNVRWGPHNDVDSPLHVVSMFSICFWFCITAREERIVHFIIQQPAAYLEPHSNLFNITPACGDRSESAFRTWMHDNRELVTCDIMACHKACVAIMAMVTT